MASLVAVVVALVVAVVMMVARVRAVASAMAVVVAGVVAVMMVAAVGVGGKVGGVIGGSGSGGGEGNGSKSGGGVGGGGGNGCGGGGGGRRRCPLWSPCPPKTSTIILINLSYKVIVLKKTIIIDPFMPPHPHNNPHPISTHCNAPPSASPLPLPPHVEQCSWKRGTNELRLVT
jgi:hypothetical protein